jgi:hypothetical protein
MTSSTDKIGFMDKTFENCARTYAQAAADCQWEVAELAARRLAGLQGHLEAESTIVRLGS